MGPNPQSFQVQSQSPNHCVMMDVHLFIGDILFLFGVTTFKGKESAHNMRLGFHPWVRKIPWGREWLPTTVFFPGESHGQRSLAVYSP